MATNIIALFRNREDAQNAVQDLMRNGFSRQDISIVANDEKGEFQKYSPDKSGDIGSAAMTGAGGGAVVGGLIGLLSGLGAIALPGIGIVAGPIAGLLGGAAIGAAGGGLVGALAGLGMSQSDATAYAEGVKRGGTLVAVHASDATASKAEDILDKYNPEDVDEKDRMPSDSTAGTVTNSVTETRVNQPVATDVAGEQKYQVVQEELAVGKREVERGGVRVKSYVTERPVTEQVTLREETVNVQRNPVDRPASPQDLETFKEGTIEVREVAEVPVVNKEARVVEEVVVSKSSQERVEAVKEMLKETHVDVEQMDQLKSDFTTRYGSTGADWNDYSPAYQYGYRLSSDERFRGRDWNTIESDVRSDWERQQPGTWDRFKDAIQSSWNHARTGRKAELY